MAIDSQQYEEAQELCSILASLNYDGQMTIVTPESFSEPNFPLVYKILHWFSVIITGNESESQTQEMQMHFLESGRAPSVKAKRLSYFLDMTSYLSKRLRTRLDLLALYRSDLSSCSELLKLARRIFEIAQMADREHDKFVTDSEWPATEQRRKVELFAEVSKYFDDTMMRLSLGSKREAPTSGEGGDNEIADEKAPFRALLNHLVGLTNEVEKEIVEEDEKLNKERQIIIGRRFEAEIVEKALRSSQVALARKADELVRTNEELDRDLARLNEKLKAKEMEIDEAKSRLDRLLIESPAYAKRCEELRKDYAKVYEDYIGSYRNFQYLKGCIYSADEQQLFSKSEEDSQSGDELNYVSREDSTVETLISKLGAQLDLAAAEAWKPSEEETAPVFLEGRDGGAEPSETVGPARLLESLFDATGASKPMSASATFEATMEADELALASGTIGGWRERALARDELGRRGNTRGPLELAGELTGDAEALLDEELLGELSGCDGAEPADESEEELGGHC